MVLRREVAKLVIIQGPTASGKTELAVSLAERFGAEIINADSMQVYCFMDIGTAKPSLEQRRRIPHHLIDIVRPDQPFTAADFRREAGRAIHDITVRGKRVIICGGTGLYIKALTKGLMESPGSDERVRSELKELSIKLGKEVLHNMLLKVDPDSAARLHPNDQFRIIRALEVHRITGRPISELKEKHGFISEPYRCMKIGLSVDRAAVYANIDKRVDWMIVNNLIDEVRGLLAAGYEPSLKPLRSIGYRHICLYLNGEISLLEAISLIKRDTRRYAKRQLTWFNHDQEIKWFEYPENVAIIMQNVNDFFD
jgi:tRNA dimethylallyltransferase